MRAVWFQVLFHSPPGVLFTFPSRYWFAIGGSVYLALEGGPPRFPQGSSCPVVLGYQLTGNECYKYGALTRSGAPFQAASLFSSSSRLLKFPPEQGIGRRGYCYTLRPIPYARLKETAVDPTTPDGEPPGLGSGAFARRYLRYHVCFLFLRVLRCFSSPRALSCE